MCVPSRMLPFMYKEIAGHDVVIVVLDRFGYSKGKSNIYVTLSELSGVPESTL